MRLQVGSPVLVRNTPSLNGTCGSDNHVCTAADAIPSGQYGVVQIDPPVFESAGWWCSRIAYETGVTGWSSAYPPYLNQLTPPQMAQGFNFRVVGDYAGPGLTQGICINDGVQSAAVLNLQPQSGGTGVTGTMSCAWTMPPIGNHITVIQGVNTVGPGPLSAEFQFSVTAKVVPQPPGTPQNLRIAPVSEGVTANTLGAKK